ncbi:terminase large subunit domain-containing protein (plasmid) [Priestia megaterium]
MDRAHQWLDGTDAKWSEANKQWKFPSGATLTFAYLASENDKFNYQGSEYQFVGFDELSQFDESQYRYLFLAYVDCKVLKCLFGLGLLLIRR